MATRHHMAPLARHQITIRGAPITARLAERRRLVAFAELFQHAARKPDALYALTRKEPRCALPDEKQRQMIHDGIREGVISREQIIRYRATQLLDDLAAFPDAGSAAEALYVPMVREIAQALDAQTVAHGVPTPANQDTAVRESKEAIAVLELHCAALVRRGQA